MLLNTRTEHGWGIVTKVKKGDGPYDVQKSANVTEVRDEVPVHHMYDRE